MSKQLTINGIIRYYWNEEENHCPYECILKDLDDKTSVNLRKELEGFCDYGDDGREFQIVIKIGKVPEIAKGHIWKYTKPHTYERVKKKRSGGGKK